MSAIDGALLDFNRLELLAAGDSFLHRVDPRVKVLTSLAFMVCVVSFGRYELSALVPFFLFPAVLMGLGDLPVALIVKKTALVCPLALLVGIFNPVFDRSVQLHLGSLEVSGGWLSCASILLRAALTASAAVIMVAVTGFPAICRALERLGTPRTFAVQLLFLYRYLFVLSAEGGRAARARELRSFGRKGQGLTSYASLVGHLLLRTFLRAERIHMAMLARGFTGVFHAAGEPRVKGSDLLFLFGWCGLFVVLRRYNCSELLGTLATGMFK